MGRRSTGARTCEGSKRLEMSYLLKEKHLQKGCWINGPIYWFSGGQRSGSIYLESLWSEEDKYIRLEYTLTQYGEKQNYNYKIQLATIPSNLGVGEVPYFICPVSGKKCRVLYLSYDSHIFKSREAYQNRLYYDSQISAKMDYANNRYWATNRKLEAIKKEKYLKYSYDGKPTRKAKYIKDLEEKIGYWDRERLKIENMPYSLRKMFMKYYISK